MSAPPVSLRHPGDALLRVDRFPHIWCPGCGLGNVLRCFSEAVLSSGTPPDRHVVVSGIGCTGRSAGYIHVDSYHTTHGRAIPFATGMKLANPDLVVSVISGDGDLTTIGGNHLMHAARRNVNLKVVLVNNFNYGMTGGQFGATTPHAARTSTSPYGNFERPFNVPLLMAACGAPYVARWTTLHVRQLKQAIERLFQVDGFGIVEVISPCPAGFGKKNGYANALLEMQHFLELAIVDHRADLWKLDVTMATDERLVLGNFVDKERQAYGPAREALLAKSKEGRK